MDNKIGWIPIENFSSKKTLKFCEAPRHENMMLPAFAVIVVDSHLYDTPVVQMVCKECWDHFDKDMNSPNWNLLEQ